MTTYQRRQVRSLREDNEAIAMSCIIVRSKQTAQASLLHFDIATPHEDACLVHPTLIEKLALQFLIEPSEFFI
jgi:hypothetical protein